MFLTDRKLDRRAAEIKNYRYRDIKKLETFAVKEDMQGIVNPELPRNFEDWEEKRLPEKWTGRDRYLWMHKNIRIPEEWKGKRALGIFDFGRTGVGNNEGFEALLYVDGHPYQGVDGNHKEVFFDESLYGKEISLIFRLWSGLEGGGVPRELEHICSQADLAWLDEKTDDLYYMGTMVLETIKILKEEDPIRHELQKALDAAFHCIDWSYPGSEEFYESVYQADDLLNQKIDAMDKHSLVRVNCVGHTHMDHAWLWRIKHTREKCSRSFSTVLRLMEQYPEYIFMHSQPQQYENIKKDFPEIYAKMQQKAKEGQWETGGAMWVEADCNLTSGESLTRQILLGSKFFKDEFNQETEFLWLPDVFGYSWALPQILKKPALRCL